MRAIKKVLALCLAAILLLALCPAAFADTTSATNATITTIKTCFEFSG